MHSSRMRTGRTLTVFRCLVPGGCIPKESRNQKKFPPPKNWGVPLNPPQPPPQNWRPPEKLETPLGPDQTPGTDLQGMLGYPPGTDLQGMLGYPPRLTCKACWDTQPPPVGRMTHACENITLAKTSFRPVKIALIY